MDFGAFLSPQNITLGQFECSKVFDLNHWFIKIKNSHHTNFVDRKRRKEEARREVECREGESRQESCRKDEARIEVEHRGVARRRRRVVTVVVMNLKSSVCYPSFSVSYT